MKPLRIACYGFVDRDSGSCAKAHFLMLEEMAKRGIAIDFFGWRGFNLGEPLEIHQNFRYYDLPSASSVDEWMNRLPSKLSQGLYPFANIVFNDDLHYQAIEQEMLKQHHDLPYDAILFMGLNAPFSRKGVPILSLIQGAPGSEWNLIQKHRKTIIQFCGMTLYAKLKIYYALKDQAARKKLRCSDIVLCTSQWTKQEVVRSGFNPSKVYVLPYPLELDRFSPRSDESVPKQEKVLLSLGRLDPRKRLDLLLDAFALVLQERNDVRLKIVGGFNYVPGYRRMIDAFPFPDKLEYQSFVPQAEAHQLLQSCDLLIQPSEGENFGSSVAEAAACGLPVVLGPTNGTKDYLQDAAFMFEDYTPESLKVAILAALEALDADAVAVRSRMRAAAEQHFHVADVVDTLTSVMAEVAVSGQSSNLPLMPVGGNR
jgi:glycosyltransferase involved in cell wall biosynthesis